MSDLISEARTKVLIAEDEPIVALDLQGMVTRLGYDVVATVDNGSAAVAAARRFIPDIILLDIALSGSFDGIEVARKIHEFSPVPIVFCISTPDLAALMRAKEISYAGYLLKPINPDSLSTTLDTVLYKYTLEKRAELAEERYRTLEKTCTLLRYFSDHDAAYHWKGSAADGIQIEGITKNSPAGEFLYSAIPSVLEGDRLARIVTDEKSDSSYAVFAVHDSDDGCWSGMVIPVSPPAR